LAAAPLIALALLGLLFGGYALHRNPQVEPDGPGRQRPMPGPHPCPNLDNRRAEAPA